MTVESWDILELAVTEVALDRLGVSLGDGGGGAGGGGCSRGEGGRSR